jgi:hypothetical protein
MNKGTAKRKRITNEMIEEHLKKQDTNSMKAIWLTPFSFAAAIILSGVSLWVTIHDYGLIIVGFVYGGFVYWAYRRLFKGVPS